MLAPQLTVLDAGTAHRLAAYVTAGGHLLLGPRSGMKDGDNALAPARQPGPLAALLGGRVDYYYPLDKAVTLSGPALTANGRVWAETLEVAPGTTVLARYAHDSGWLSSKPAFVMRERGQGWIAYLGTLLEADGQAALVGWIRARAALSAPIVSALPDLEIVERRRGQDRYLIAINHGERARAPAFPSGFTTILGDLRSRTLPPHGVALLACVSCDP